MNHVTIEELRRISWAVRAGRRWKHVEKLAARLRGGAA